MNAAINGYLRLYLQFRKVGGLASSTLKGYDYHVKDFAKHIPEGSDDYRAAALAYLGQEGIAPNTFNFRRKYLLCFFSWCVREGYLKDNPLRGIPQRKPTNRIVAVDDNVIEELLRLPNRFTFAGCRDYALLLFSLDTGSRPSESLQLKAEDFNFVDNIVTIPAAVAKTRESRTLPISPQTVAAIFALLSVHSRSWTVPPVFCSNRGEPLRGNAWGHILKDYSQRVGANITPYSLRHIAALGMLRQGMNVFALKDMLGHADISMTQKYIALTIDDLKKAHAKASLLNSVLPAQPNAAAPSKRVMRIGHNKKRG